MFVANVAIAQSRDEYNAQVEAAKAKVSAAQEALIRAQEAYNAVVATGVSLSSQIAQATQNLQAAQAAYDQSQIPDPAWVRPTVEQTYTVSVPYTVQIPYTVSEPRQVETTTTIQVPHTTTVTTTTQVPRQITTVVPAGLVAKSYNMYGYNNRPPLPTENRLVSTEVVPNINFQWGSGMVLNSGLYEDVIVNFSGTIYAPQTGTYSFYAPADDGTKLIIDGSLVIDDWFDKGGGGSTRQINLTEGSHTITLWYYENGGGANVWLYWATPGNGLTLVPASAFGEQTVTTTVYDEVTTTQEVTTYTEETVTTTETVYVDVVYYRDEVAYRDEERTRIVDDENAVHPNIKDPSLLPAIDSAQNSLNNLNASQAQNSVIIESASTDVASKQQELNVAQQELEAIPPFREPTPTPTQTTEPTKEPTTPVVQPTPTPEPSQTPEVPAEPQLPVDVKTVDPNTLTDQQAAELVVAANAVLATAEQGSPAYEEALQALAVAAVADDPVLPAALENIPGAAAVLETFNALGNVGADMAPQVRDQAEKTVIASVIASGAAVQASLGAATSAATSAAATASATTSSSSGGSSGGGASSESKTKTTSGRTRRMK